MEALGKLRKGLLPLRLISAKLLGIKSPLLIAWSITHRCNLKCGHCSIWQTPSDELTTAEIMDAIGEMGSLGTYAISFVGGEPLLREDLDVILRECKRLGIKSRVTSNGSVLTRHPERIEDVDILKLSLDGTRKTHDRIREEGSFEQVMESARWAKDRGIRTIFNCVISKYLAEEIEDVLKIAERFDVPITFQPLEHRSEAAHEVVAMEMPSPGQMLTIIQKLAYMKRRNPGLIGNSRSGLAYMESWPVLNPIRCYAGLLYCRISPEGDVMACDRVEEGRGGNMRESGFARTFESLIQIKQCDGCWRNNTIDINRSLSLNINAITDIVKNYMG